MIANNSWFPILAGTLLVLLSSPAHAGCGASVCSINTNWNVQGVWSEPGGRIESTQVYGFIQAPIYTHVNGIQLTSNWAVVAGINSRF